jgi:hypothetical protein
MLNTIESDKFIFKQMLKAAKLHLFLLSSPLLLHDLVSSANVSIDFF